ncbi:MAG TPA: bifunctional adenosylcobinamide kinase/adenosylcobinamide-phosphate guanylyltransferase [Nitrospinae bacterium]|nr:bifunctional adenosylcobinamide kinase/adenosylcobinamide-phosphate guanylyltransferase [Nitrospinota bacterium]
MNKIIFITGGARSGKSNYALKTAESIGKIRGYIATAEALDDEMLERIEIHRKSRGNGWHTMEEPKNLLNLFDSLQIKYDVLIIDCLTLWVSNLMEDGLDDKDILKITDKFSKKIVAYKNNIIIVTNELGMGIVPDNPLGRRFRDIAGKVNQIMASVSDEVHFMISGIPVKIK